MADLNSCSFVGRLTRDAEMQNVGAKGTALVKFAIANNTGYGQYARTNFINVQMWGNTGTNVMRWLKKGKQVAVTGQLENNKWTGKDGLEHDSWTLTCNAIQLLADASGRPAMESESASSPSPASQEVPADAKGNVAF